MIRRLAPVVLAAFVTVITLAARTEVTFVMKNGQRLSGTFVYHHTDHYNLIINGKENSYPSDDIAMIAFVPGDPSAAEIDKLPNVNDPPELDRHTMVLRNGTMIRGKIYDFVEDRVIMDVKAGDRRTFNMGDIARLYISAPGARGVFHEVPPTDPATVPGGRARGRGVAPGTIVVRAAEPLTPTGLTVTRGQRLSFATTETIRITRDVEATPDGTTAITPTRRLALPVPNMGVGGLVARVGNGQPFPIGSSSQMVTMPAAGELLLGINDDTFADNTGAFHVRIR